MATTGYMVGHCFGYQACLDIRDLRIAGTHGAQPRFFKECDQLKERQPTGVVAVVPDDELEFARGYVDGFSEAEKAH